MANSIPTYTKIPIPFANSGDKNSIPQNATGSNLASYSEGFPPITSQPITENGIPPERGDFNGLGFSTTNNISYLQQGGLYTFDAQLSSAIGGYAQGAILAYINNGQLYYLRSKINNNTYNFNTNSSYIGQYWEYASEQGGVSSVNNKTGDVNLSYSDVNAAPISHVSVEASTNVLGHVKIDGKTIQIDNNGVIKAIGGRGIGEIFAYPSALPPEGAYLLNGQTITNCQTLYPDFWNWLTSQIGEYETVPIYKAWTQTPLTADGTIGGSAYAVEPSGTIASGYPAWRSFDMTNGGSSSVCAINSSNAYLTFYSPVDLRINTVRFVRATTSMTNNRISSYIISGSNDNSTWTELASGDWTDTANSATLDISIDSSKYSTNRFYKYYKFYAESNGTNITEFPEIYLYGEEYVRTIQESNGYIRAINAEEYEAEIAEYGFCGGFVISNNDVRLPNFTNTFLMGGNSSNIGQSLAAGLPNIEGSTYLAEAHAALIGLKDNTGCINAADTGKVTNADGGYETGGSYGRQMIIDASLSNPIYGNSDTVQPPAIKVSWCIQVFNAATALSEQQSAQLASEMQMKMATDLGNASKATLSAIDTVMPDSVDYVIESYDNGTSGYRLWRSGYCEQWGDTTQAVSGYITVTFYKEFKDTNYIFLSGTSYTANTTAGMSIITADKTTTGCKIGQSASAGFFGYWFVKGYIA